MSSRVRLAGRAALMALILPSCGGGGGSPAGPSTTPSPAVNSSFDVFTTLSNGATVTIDECGGDCTSALHIRFEVVYKESVTGAQVYSQLFDSLGRECAFNMTDSFNIVAGQRTSVSTDVYTVQCDGTYGITRGRVTLFGPNTSGAPVTTRPGLIAGDFTLNWTFNRPKRPTAGPTPRPPSSTTCNGSSVPSSASCGKPTAGCKDGTWSCSQNRQGTCSSHGGVSCWVCPGPLC